MLPSTVFSTGRSYIHDCSLSMGQGRPSSGSGWRAVPAGGPIKGHIPNVPGRLRPGYSSPTPWKTWTRDFSGRTAVTDAILLLGWPCDMGRHAFPDFDKAPSYDTMFVSKETHSGSLDQRSTSESAP